MRANPTGTAIRHRARAPGLDSVEIEARVNEILNRWPAVGLAVGVVRSGRFEFYGQGMADIASGTPITENTVFRIGSITKLITAIAVMQLWEDGLIDLDAPANDYLRTYRLIPAKASFRPATVRHLLTHTAGIPDVISFSDLLHWDWGRFEDRPAAHSVPAGERAPSLAEYYGPGPRVDVEPGTAFAYTNHGFATLGQIVEDLAEVSLDRYFREHIFEPLGMIHTDAVRSDRVKSHLATGYDLEKGGATAVPDRDWVTVGGGNVLSTTRDMARFVSALLGGGANGHNSVLKAATLGMMFETHYQPDPRLSGVGLAFFRHDAGEHRVVGHDGRLPGFHGQLLAAPDDGLGVVGFTNGSSRAMFWLPTELRRLVNGLLGTVEEAVRPDIAQHPEIWNDLCGVYRAPVIDLRGRIMMGAGVEVFVRRGQLMVRLRTPIPAAYRGIQLHPDDRNDPYVFRIDLSEYGMGTTRVLFSHQSGVGATAIHTDMGLLSFQKR